MVEGWRCERCQRAARACFLSGTWPFFGPLKIFVSSTPAYAAGQQSGEALGVSKYISQLHNARAAERSSCAVCAARGGCRHTVLADGVTLRHRVLVVAPLQERDPRARVEVRARGWARHLCGTDRSVLVREWPRRRGCC